MSNLIRVYRRLMLVFILTSCCALAKAQFTPVESKNGFSLQKGTSLSSVKTGDIFTYTINFSIPAGALNVFIIDNVPSPLVIDATTIAPNYSGFVPTVTQTASSVMLYFPSVTTSISGSFQVHVHFPVDSGCNGRRVTNVAELRAERPQTYLVTKGIDVTSIVDNPWRIQKYPTAPNITYIGSNCYGTTSDTVDFTIRVVKQWWTLSGSASWYNVNLQDILPAGAFVIPASYSPNANLAGSSISAGGIITLPPGFKLDANANNVYLASFKIRHTPILDTNSCVTNTAVLGAKDACGVTKGDTSKVGVRKLKPAPIAQLSKWVSVNGNLPGCTGTYTIRVCNTGSAPLPAYTLNDPFPSCLTGVTSVLVPAGCTVTPAGQNTFNFSGTSLAPGNCHVYTFNFIIGTGCPSVITNTVTATSGFSGSASTNIWMLPPGPTACLNKSICGPLPTIYTPGTTVRFRVRVQNIGGSPMTGASVFDQLDVSNLEYVGNEVYYSWPTPFAPCGVGNAAPAGSTPWTGVTPSHIVSSGTLKWGLPAIGVECDNVPYPACGFAYGLTAYYIEFSVKIKDTAGLGNIRNCADISGTGLATVTSCVSFVTQGTLNYNVSKQVSNDNGATYSGSVTANAGANVRFKLASVNSGIPLINPVLVDLLPRNNGTNDQFILACNPRGSVYDIRYSNFVSSTHTFSSQLFSNVAGASTASTLGVTCFANPPLWAAGPSVGAANLATQLSQAVAIGTPLAYVFDAATAATAHENEVACNNYGIRGAAKYIINYVTTYPLQTPLESGVACVTIKKDCCKPLGFDIPKDICINTSTKFCVKDTCHPQNIYYWDFGDGSPQQSGVCVNHTYTSAGTYIITVKWKDDCGEYIKEFQVKVDKCCCKPIGFEIPKDLCNKYSYKFCVKDTCNPANIYTWDFGDGSPQQTGLCVNHAYGSPGGYTITVKWKDDCGEYSEQFDVKVEQCHCDVKTKFIVNTSGLSITADGTPSTSSWPIAIYVWDFGDGSYGTGPIVNHTYANNGWYLIRLTVYVLDENGNICECKDECRVEIYVDKDKESIFYCNYDPKAQQKIVHNVTLKASPNPFRDNITVSFDFVNKAKVDQSGYQLELVNANGIVLQSRKLKNLERTVALDSRMYASGIYFIVLKNLKGEVQNMRVVKL